TPILISSLGKYEYGIWVVIGQIISFLLIADLGVSSSVGRLIAKYDALNSIDKKISIYSSALLIFLFSVVVIALLVFLVMDSIPGLLKVNAEYSLITTNIFLIMTVNFILVFPLRVGRGLLQAAHRFDYIDMVLTVGKVAQVCIIFVLFYTQNISLLKLAWMMAIINVSTEVFIFIKAKLIYRDVFFDTKSVDFETFKEMFSLGGASLLQSVSGVLSQQGMVFLVGVFLGVLYVPLFSIPLLLLVILGSLVGKIGTSFMPAASAYDSLYEVQKISNLSVYGARYSFMLGALIAVFICLYGEQLLTFWLPESEISGSDIDIMFTILMVVLIPFILARSNQGNKVILSSTGNHWLVSNGLFVMSIFSLVTTILLVIFTELGVYCFAIGWVVKLFFGDYFLILYFLCRKYSINLKEYLFKVYLKPIIVVLPVIVLSFFVRNVFEGDGLLLLAINSGLFFLISIVCVCVLGVEKSHMNILLTSNFISGFSNRK
ncbi:MAG: O-antigen/teichoic acid export membrane protein, partial [Psychroserpens sp.]